MVARRADHPDEEVIQQHVQACQNGDVEAFSFIYDAYIQSVFRYVYYRINKQDVEDVVEKVFVKVWENIDKYQRGEHPFAAWLFRIAHNLVVDQYRFQRTHISLNEDLPKHVVQSDENPVDFAGKRLKQDYVRAALTELKESYQQVLVLKFLTGFSNQEVANIMKCSVANVRILQYRALKKLRRVLEKHGFNCNDLM